MSTPTRRLVAIFFSDIVGYTKMMGEDQLSSLDILRQSREIQKNAIERFNGKWLKEMGDGVLAQFETAYDSIKAALEIQEKANEQLSAKIRIGIHLGDVTFENDDVFGDGVNIASRLQSIADPGGIYISESVYQAVSAYPTPRGRARNLANAGVFYPHGSASVLGLHRVGPMRYAGEPFGDCIVVPAHRHTTLLHQCLRDGTGPRGGQTPGAVFGV